MSDTQTQWSRGGIAAELQERYATVRAFSEQLCKPLETEDYVIQSMPDASPTRWHISHTTWFFETFVLKSGLPDYRPFSPQFEYLFNSYYNTVGEQFPRPRRGLLSRPTVREVMEYRAHVDRHMNDLLAGLGDRDDRGELGSVVELGLHHEQQHQELMLTDIKHVFSCNPLHPVYRETRSAGGRSEALRWLGFEEGLRWIGHEADGFCYDNEGPRHRVFLPAFEIADRLVTCGEFMQFMEEGGYGDPRLWLSEGWTTAQAQQWQAPLYWEQRDGRWCQFTLSGLRDVEPAEPVCHVSYFEADAFARWAGARLPTEFEWEVASEQVPVAGNFADREAFHPAAPEAPMDGSLRQMYGDVWEWTASPYVAYPGYRPVEGALGEYNGKFMCNQFVLRGGSCATSQTHIRPTYRNFWPAGTRFQFAGLRLAR